jgi:hypothetical protein
MKLLTKISSITMSCILLTMPFVEATSTSENNDRLYIDSAMVHIENQGIFLNLHDKVLPITGIAQDEKGVYVTVDSAAVNMTTCRRCGKDYDSDNQSSRCPHGWILIR